MVGHPGVLFFRKILTRFAPDIDHPIATEKTAYARKTAAAPHAADKHYFFAHIVFQDL